MDEEVLRNIADTLYGGLQKDTAGEAAKLKNADPATRKVWVRMAKCAVTAVKKVSDRRTGAPAAATVATDTKAH